MSVNQQDKQYHGESRSWVRARLWRLAGPWWVLLLTGIAWLIISVIVLRFTTTSAATLGVLLGVIFLGATLNEFLLALVRRHWRWVHGITEIVLAFELKSAQHR